MSNRICLSASEPCGCIAWVEFLGYGHDAKAYTTAGRHARRGRVIRQELVEAWRERPFHCPDHPSGPPWWKSNGGNGKRPPEYDQLVMA